MAEEERTNQPRDQDNPTNVCCCKVSVKLVRSYRRLVDSLREERRLLQEELRFFREELRFHREELLSRISVREEGEDVIKREGLLSEELRSLREEFSKISVREEVEDVIKRVVLPRLPSPQTPSLPPRSSANLAESSSSRCLQLHFVGPLPHKLLTLTKILDEGASFIVELRDSLGHRVKSSAKIKIVALYGDFEVEDRDHWTLEEFKKNIVLPRTGKGPLLMGESDIFLHEGAADISDIQFTDNSKWTRSGKFRLGAQAMKGVHPETSIREAVSKAFQVKERRAQSYQKHETPNLEDKIWRLKGIAKGGPIDQRLADAEVRTVKDFLQLYCTDADKLQDILHVSENKWQDIVNHAKLCSFTSEQYRYHDETKRADLKKDEANKLREIAYEKRGELPKTYIPTNQPWEVGEPQPTFSSSNLCMNMQFLSATATDQGDPMMQVNSYGAWDVMPHNTAGSHNLGTGIHTLDSVNGAETMVQSAKASEGPMSQSNSRLGNLGLDVSTLGSVNDAQPMVLSANAAGDPMPHGARDDSQKDIPDISMETASEIWGELPNTYVPTNQPQELAQTQPIFTYSILCSNGQYINSRATVQGEQMVQGNTYSSSLEPYTPGYNNYQPEATPIVVEDSDPYLQDKLWSSLE